MTSEMEFSFKDILENANDIIIVTKAFPLDDPGPEIVYVNKAFTDFTGYSYQEVIGLSPRILQSSDTDIIARRKIRKALIKQQPVRATIKNYSKFGKEYWLDISILPLRNAEGVVTHFAAIQRDVTSYKTLELKLEGLSKTDSLTNVCNHRGFVELSTNNFSIFKRNGSVYSVLMLDLDYFKKLNDQYGHMVGDQAIRHFSAVCEKNIRQHDIVARVGGEEFCILLPDTSQHSALLIAEKIRKILVDNPLMTEDRQINMTVSIGTSEVSSTDVNHNDVIKRADKKLYMAKEQGRNCVF